MKTAGQIFVISFLAFKLIFGQNSCITTYQSNVYLIETNTTSTNIKSFQLPSTSSSLPPNKNSTYDTLIPWKNEAKTQQGVTSLFSCTTVHHYLFLLTSPSIPSEQQQQPNDGENNNNVKSILTFNYESHQWKTLPLSLDPPSTTLITSSWNTQYIAYNTEKHTAYYFNTQLWSWHSNDDQNDAQSPPLSSTPTTATTPEMATVNSTLYYLLSDASDHHQNHIYSFDLMTKKWYGHFASFWSNTSSFYFSSNHIDTLYAIPRFNNDNDRFMRTIHINSTSALMVQTPTLELQANDLVTSMGEGVGGDLVFYNGTRLMIYQPSTNTISAIYGQDDLNPPSSNNTTLTPPSPPSFWSTPEGERIKIALGCSLSIGMILITVIGMILLRNRRQHLQDRDLLEESPAHMKRETNQDAAATGTTARTTKLSTSMQSLSFLNRDNAMVWSRNVHQLLALITFRRRQEEEAEAEAEGDEDYPSMIKTSTTVSALAMSSMILSIISSSYSISATNNINNNNALLAPQTQMNRRSLDMACPLPRNTIGQAESSSHHNP